MAQITKKWEILSERIEDIWYYASENSILTSFCFLFSVCLFVCFSFFLQKNCFDFTLLEKRKLFSFYPIATDSGNPQRGISAQCADSPRNARGRVHGCGNLTTRRRGCACVFRGGSRVRDWPPGPRWGGIAALRNFLICEVSRSSKRKQAENSRCVK